MRVFLPIFLFVVALCAVASFWASYTYFRAEELAKADARLSLYRSTVVAELQRFSHLPYVLAQDPIVIAETLDANTQPLNERLAAFADRAEIDAIYLMDLTGKTRASSNAETPGSFVGQNYAFRPYFRAAMAGDQGTFYGIGATTGIPGYFFAEAVRGAAEEYLGVIAIKINLTALQDSWQEAGERVILANADGVALLTSVPSWRYKTLGVLQADQRERIAAARQFGDQPLDQLEWTFINSQSAEIDGEYFLYQNRDDLPNGWSLHYFAPDDQAVTQAWLTSGLLVLAVGFAFIAFQVQRTRRIGTALKLSEQEEVQLRASNERLAVEIEERKTAERRLLRTQAELERAGRLAALGQLSASVTHELGQPIAAMRNHLAAAEMQSTQTVLTKKLQSLVDRMEGITKQLKFFARKGRDNLEDVDLRSAMQVVLDLVSPNLSEASIQSQFIRPEEPVLLKANRLRIEQVMTNLLRNAIDATDGQEMSEIIIEVGTSASEVWFEVADNGHGLGDNSLDELREPFATNRESGKGMGLGLTISAGIVDDHNGEMTASNRDGGGAVFRATFSKEKAEVNDA